jgi:Fuc2NAc and GlcNAc transferase
VLAVALVGGGSLIAAVGWLDDRRGLPASVRAAAHAVAACWAVLWLGGLPTLDLGGSLLPLGWVGSILAVAGIVWTTNLYNFMDGIDGLAAGEAIVVGAVAGTMLLAAGHPGLALATWLVSAASAGFLVWNWPPARIFMGDVGSGLIGYLLATLAIASENARALPLAAWVLLALVFVFDATVTLLRRALKGERWYAAHRSHAYQRAVQSGLSHARVTAGALGLDLALALLACVGWIWPALLLPALGIAVVLLAAVYLMIERHSPMYPPSSSDGAPRSA